MCDKYVIIGAGPAGVAAAIFLAKRGYDIQIYEKASDLQQNLEDSYPIGLNPRGMNVLDLLDETGKLREQVAGKTPIDAWCIYSGEKRVARMESGTTVGATRGGVANSLYDHAVKHHSDKITFFFQHKLIAVDYENQKLTFEKLDGDQVNLDAGSNTRIIACDGVWSKVRSQYEQFNSSFKTKVSPWDCSFRLLFSDNHPNQIQLNPNEHHVFSSGIYVALVDQQKWVIAVQISNSNSQKDNLMSNEDSEENREILKKYIKDNCPLVVPMIPDHEYSLFFSRRTFSGAVVCVPKLNIDEWVLFLGDSAHSVYPAIGEGINCALEDARVFDSCLQSTNSSNNDLFELYHQERYKDIKAVTTYANFLVESSTTTDESEKLAQLLTTISLQIGKKLGFISAVWSDKSFGTSAEDVQPYHVMLDNWEHQTKYLLPATRKIASGITAIRRLFS